MDVPEKPPARKIVARQEKQKRNLGNGKSGTWNTEPGEENAEHGTAETTEPGTGEMCNALRGLQNWFRFLLFPVPSSRFQVPPFSLAQNAWRSSRGIERKLSRRGLATGAIMLSVVA